MKATNTILTRSKLLKTIFLAALFAALLATPAICLAAAGDYELRREITGARLTEEGSYTIGLYAKRERGSLFDSALMISVKDETSGKTYRFEPAEIAGYEADIAIASFVKPGKSELFLSMQSGGSGGYGYYYVITFDGRAARFLYRSDDDRLPDAVIGMFDDNYRCRVAIEGTATRALLDIAARKAVYVESQVYDEGTGKLLNPVALYGGTYGVMGPTEPDAAGLSELRGIVSYSGLYHADTICTVTFTQSFKDGSWHLTGSEITPMTDLRPLE